MNTLFIACNDDSRPNIKSKNKLQVNLPPHDTSLDETNIVTLLENNGHFNETNPSQLEGSNCKSKTMFNLLI